MSFWKTSGRDAVRVQIQHREPDGRQPVRGARRGELDDVQGHEHRVRGAATIPYLRNLNALQIQRNDDILAHDALRERLR